MSADQRFSERIRRIEMGQQWAPEGVIHQPRATVANRERRKRGRKGFLLGLVIVAGIVATAGAPEETRAGFEAFLAEPSVDTARAALITIPFLDDMAAP